MRKFIFASWIAMAVVTSHVPAAAQSDAQRAQDRYNRYMQQQKGAADADNREHENLRLIERQIDAFPVVASSEEPLRTFCRKTLQSTGLSAQNRSLILINCKNKLADISRKKAAESEKDKERASAVKYANLEAELKAMPPTNESIRELRHLLSNNNYRLRTLTFSDQNKYFMRIQSRLSEFENEAIDHICRKLVTAKLSVPATVKNALIIDVAGGISLTQFLCGALVSSKNVIVAASDRSFEIHIDDFSLRFAVGRYLIEQRIAVPMDSPIQGGNTALSLEAVKVRGNRIDIGNPKAFVTNFYSQWTPQLSAYLQQQRQ